MKRFKIDLARYDTGPVFQIIAPAFEITGSDLVACLKYYTSTKNQVERFLDGGLIAINQYQHQTDFEERNVLQRIARPSALALVSWVSWLLAGRYPLDYLREKTDWYRTDLSAFEHRSLAEWSGFMGNEAVVCFDYGTDLTRARLESIHPELELSGFRFAHWEHAAVLHQVWGLTY